jgi:hypothetical protein
VILAAGVLAIAVVLGLAVRQHRSERNHPLSAAFGATFLAVFLVVPGFLGYELQKTGQIYLGLVFVAAGNVPRRKALRALPSLRRCGLLY